MLLKKVAAKAHNSIIVTDDLGVTRPLKKLNFVWAGGTKQDTVAVADPASGFIVGRYITFPDNLLYLIAKITDDYYKEEKIRSNLELVICDNAVTISRQAVQSNNQGGISGHIDTIVYDTLPCKVINISQTTDKQDDVQLLTYAMYISSLKPLDINDKLQFAHSYNVAKAEGIRLVTPGLLEVTFDRDLRW